MTNKKKQRAKALSEKTGVSYVGAHNLLNKNEAEPNTEVKQAAPPDYRKYVVDGPNPAFEEWVFGDLPDVLARITVNPRLWFKAFIYNSAHDRGRAKVIFEHESLGEDADLDRCLLALVTVTSDVNHPCIPWVRNDAMTASIKFLLDIYALAADQLGMTIWSMPLMYRIWADVAKKAPLSTVHNFLEYGPPLKGSLLIEATLLNREYLLEKGCPRLTLQDLRDCLRAGRSIPNPVDLVRSGLCQLQDLGTAIQDFGSYDPLFLDPAESLATAKGKAREALNDLMEDGELFSKLHKLGLFRWHSKQRERDECRTLRLDIKAGPHLAKWTASHTADHFITFEAIRYTCLDVTRERTQQSLHALWERVADWAKKPEYWPGMPKQSFDSLEALRQDEAAKKKARDAVLWPHPHSDSDEAKQMASLQQLVP